MTIIQCMVPEISSATDIIFCHFGPFFALLPTLTTWKIKILKKWIKTPRDIIILYVHHKKQSWCMVPEISSATDRIFCHLGLFLQYYCPKNLKNQNFEKMIKTLEISSFYTNVSKIMIICYTFPEIRCMADVILIFYLGLFFAL